MNKPDLARVSIPRKDYEVMRDRAVVLDVYGPETTLCPSGRIIAQRFMCPHCEGGWRQECKDPKYISKK